MSDGAKIAPFYAISKSLLVYLITSLHDLKLASNEPEINKYTESPPPKKNSYTCIQQPSAMSDYHFHFR